MINLNLIFEKQPLLILSSLGSLLHRLTIGNGLSLDAELETRHSNNQRIILESRLNAVMLKLAQIEDLAYQTKVLKCCPNRNCLLIMVKMVTSISSSQAYTMGNLKTIHVSVNLKHRAYTQVSFKDSLIASINKERN